MEITERFFEFPKKYDFDKVFKQNFGVIKENAIDVEIEFKGYFAKYVAERIWSPGQSIHKKNGKTNLQFSAASKSELLSWVMSFGGDAKVLKPEWLIKDIEQELQIMQSSYINTKRNDKKEKPQNSSEEQRELESCYQ